LKLENKIGFLQETIRDHHSDYQELKGKDTFFGQKSHYHYFSLDDGKTWWSARWNEDRSRGHWDEVVAVKPADPEHVTYLRARAGLIEQLDDLFPEREDTEQHIDQLEKCMNHGRSIGSVLLWTAANS